METNTKTESTETTAKKDLYLNIDRYFWSKDYKKLCLVLPGNIIVPVHVNFLKARLGMEYTPEPRKEKSA